MIEKLLTGTLSLNTNKQIYLSLVTRKPVFGVSDQVRLKPACLASEASWRLDISDIETRDILSINEKLPMTRVHLRLTEPLNYFETHY